MDADGSVLNGRNVEGPRFRLLPHLAGGDRVGHPEGFIEAFANLYRSVAHTIAAREAGEEPKPWALDVPTVQDGAIGVHFIETALESSRKQAWVDASYTPPDI